MYSDSDKKVHQSWGGDDGNTELKVEEAATVDAAAEGAVGNEWGTEAAGAGDAWGAPAAAADDAWALPATSGDEPAMPTTTEGDKNEGRRAREREQEEEDNTLTLDQYLAQKTEKEASLLPKLETRKANEGADDSLWKDAVQVQKGDEEEAYFAAKVYLLAFYVRIGPHSHHFSSPSPRLKLAPKRKRRSSSRLTLGLNAQTVVVVADAVAVTEAKEDPAGAGDAVMVEAAEEVVLTAPNRST